MTGGKKCSNPELHPTMCRCLPQGVRLDACPGCFAMVRQHDMPKHEAWHHNLAARISEGVPR